MRKKLININIKYAFCRTCPGLFRQVWGIFVMRQSYALGGSSDAIVRCQYCSNLFN